MLWGFANVDSPDRDVSGVHLSNISIKEQKENVHIENSKKKDAWVRYPCEVTTILNKKQERRILPFIHHVRDRKGKKRCGRDTCKNENKEGKI